MITKAPTIQFAGRKMRIPHPPLSTLKFSCPTCGAEVETWCSENGLEVSVCKARKALYSEVYNRYITGVQNGSICPFITPHHELDKQIQSIIQEVQTENEQRNFTA